jgi:hypothetical protein
LLGWESWPAPDSGELEPGQACIVQFGTVSGD